MSFRSRLKAYISYQNLKITDLSEEVEVTANTLYRYLNGKTDIGSDKLIKLLNSFDCVSLSYNISVKFVYVHGNVSLRLLI